MGYNQESIISFDLMGKTLSWDITLLALISVNFGRARPVPLLLVPYYQQPWYWIWRITHWGRATNICVSETIIIGSDNGLSPGRCQAIIWANAGIMLIGPLGINFNEILIEFNAFSFKKMYLKMSSAKWRLFRLGLIVITGFLSYIRGMSANPVPSLSRNDTYCKCIFYIP